MVKLTDTLVFTVLGTRPDGSRFCERYETSAQASGALMALDRGLISCSATSPDRLSGIGFTFKIYRRGEVSIPHPYYNRTVGQIESSLKVS
jgi:hypothetical protein